MQIANIRGALGCPMYACTTEILPLEILPLGRSSRAGDPPVREILPCGGRSSRAGDPPVRWGRPWIC